MSNVETGVLVEPVEEARPAPQPAHHASPIAEPHAVETLEQHASHLAASRQLCDSNVLPVLGRWKIVDTLRRSLVQPTVLLWLLAGWTILPGSPVRWTLLVIFVLVSNLLFSVAPNFLLIARQSSQANFFNRFRHIVKLSVSQLASLALQLSISLTYLAHHSYLFADAITRALYRRLISHKHLLEWVTAAQAQKGSALSLRSSLHYMRSALIIAPACGVLILLIRPEALPVAAPFLLAWALSPFIVHLSNRHKRERSILIEPMVERAIRLNARRMWRTLESFLGLKYDTHSFRNTRNQGEYINPLRSSPVNLARLLLWTEASYELGSIGIIELAERLDLALAEMRRLQCSTSRGQKLHDTQMFEPLAPPSVLHAENGNLAGHLRTLKQFCSEIGERPLFDERVLKGFTDTLSLMTEGAGRLSITPPGIGDDALKQLRDEIEMCVLFLRALNPEKSLQTFSAWHRLFNTLAQRAFIIEDLLNLLSQKYSAKNVVALRFWTNALIRQAQGLNDDLNLFAPWTSLRTAHLALLISKYNAPALTRWNHVVEMLNRSSTIARLPKTMDVALIELTVLDEQFEHLLPLNTCDLATVLSGCGELKSAVADALRAANDMRSRYARLANESKDVMDTMNFHSLFDEERKVFAGSF